MPDDIETLRPSLLSLLTDENPRAARESVIPGSQPAQIMQSVINDLTNLLNSRKRAIHWADRGRSGHALWEYGLPDFSAADAQGVNRNAAVADWIAGTIKQHEPRLKNVRVTARPSRSEASRSIGIKIEAELAIEPFQQLTLSSTYEASTGRFGLVETQE